MTGRPVVGGLRLLPAGPRAVLVEVGSVAEASALYLAARSSGLGMSDLVPAARTVLFDGLEDLAALERWLGGVDLSSSTTVGPAPLVELPTSYAGVDLDDVARRWGMTRAEAVATHTGTEFTVAFCGFSPGFAYCTGLPDELSVPRLDTPRTRVPAGAVGVAGAFTGVYPRESPGGWRLLGRTERALWDSGADEPALLVPGTRVRFVEVSS